MNDRVGGKQSNGRLPKDGDKIPLPARLKVVLDQASKAKPEVMRRAEEAFPSGMTGKLKAEGRKQVNSAKKATERPPATAEAMRVPNGDTTTRNRSRKITQARATVESASAKTPHGPALNTLAQRMIAAHRRFSDPGAAIKAVLRNPQNARLAVQAVSDAGGQFEFDVRLLALLIQHMPGEAIAAHVAALKRVLVSRTPAAGQKVERTQKGVEPHSLDQTLRQPLPVLPSRVVPVASEQDMREFMLALADTVARRPSLNLVLESLTEKLRSEKFRAIICHQGPYKVRDEMLEAFRVRHPEIGTPQDEDLVDNMIEYVNWNVKRQMAFEMRGQVVEAMDKAATGLEGLLDPARLRATARMIQDLAYGSLQTITPKRDSSARDWDSRRLTWPTQRQ